MRTEQSCRHKDEEYIQTSRRLTVAPPPTGQEMTRREKVTLKKANGEKGKGGKTNYRNDTQEHLSTRRPC